MDVMVKPSNVTSLDEMVIAILTVPAWTVVSSGSAAPLYAKTPSPVVLRYLASMPFLTPCIVIGREMLMPVVESKFYK